MSCSNKIQKYSKHLRVFDILSIWKVLVCLNLEIPYSWHLLHLFLWGKQRITILSNWKVIAVGRGQKWFPYLDDSCSQFSQCSY